MREVVVIFVPTEASQRDFETALHEHLASVQVGDGKSPKTTGPDKREEADKVPLWVWFIPHSCH